MKVAFAVFAVLAFASLQLRDGDAKPISEDEQLDILKDLISYLSLRESTFLRNEPQNNGGGGKRQGGGGGGPLGGGGGGSQGGGDGGPGSSSGTDDGTSTENEMESNPFGSLSEDGTGAAGENSQENNSPNTDNAEPSGTNVENSPENSKPTNVADNNPEEGMSGEQIDKGSQEKSGQKIENGPAGSEETNPEKEMDDEEQRQSIVEQFEELRKEQDRLAMDLKEALNNDDSEETNHIRDLLYEIENKKSKLRDILKSLLDVFNDNTESSGPQDKGEGGQGGNNEGGEVPDGNTEGGEVPSGNTEGGEVPPGGNTEGSEVPSGNTEAGGGQEEPPAGTGTMRRRNLFKKLELLRALRKLEALKA